MRIKAPKSTLLENIKFAIASFCTIASGLAPLGLFLWGVIRLDGMDNYWAVLLFGAAGSIALTIWGLKISSVVGNFFLWTWGREYIEIEVTPVEPPPAKDEKREEEGK